MYIVAVVFAVILAIWGVLTLLDGNILMGILLLIAACVVGPGGYSIFNRGRGGGV